MPALCESLKSRNEPNTLVLQMGKNDLVACFTVQLLDNLSQHITKIKCLMSSTRLVWADMLPQYVWYSANSNKAINLGRRKANKQESKIIGWNHRVVIAQPGIHFDLPHIYCGYLLGQHGSGH